MNDEGQKNMTPVWHYANPVRIIFGPGSFGTAAREIAGRPYCLVTYGDNPAFEHLAGRLMAAAGEPVAFLHEVEPNPSYTGLRAATQRYGQASSRPAVIVALGGGSVIDTAKVLAAGGGDFGRVQDYLEGRTDPGRLGDTPIIAIPTTAGTGSEVTSWATVWDTANKRKYSLARPNLYPECAIVDPELARAAPRGLTISTGLDALSHALESIWNVNANPVSANYAVFAATEVLETLPLLARKLDDIDHRARMARASLFAGLAFSNTKTALAHSLSYHLTMHYGVAHGIACSFSLPAVMASVVGCDAACDRTLSRIFGPDLAGATRRLSAFLNDLGVSTRPTDHGAGDAEWAGVINAAMEGERGRNFIGRKPAFLEAA